VIYYIQFTTIKFIGSQRPRNAGRGSWPVLTKKQAAEYLQCTTRFIERHITAGHIRSCKPTKKFVRIRRKELDAFLENGLWTK
jgi:excisionase family DNA binding protein